ncbi:MAG: glycosyltransferase family 39 protein [Burkholderiaceae bacterium]|nr:glycosyltransferase family 39 protein [Burkholderiaceae bacterium]
MEHSQIEISTAPPTLHIPLWLVWAVALAFVLSALGGYGILDNNEGLYAEIPREMLASHDWRHWVIPHLNGLPYMEKPPLLYWLTALSFALFGVAEWSARLVPALASLTCVLSLLRFGDALQRPQAGRLAALMFISGLGVMAMSRTLMFDMLLTACLSAALMNAYLYHIRREVAKLRHAYAWLALALMAKGMVALVLFGAVLFFLLLPTLRSVGLLQTCRDWLEPRAVLIFVAIAAPWHIAASLVEPIFPWFYFINEHVLRFLGKREPHDYYSGAWWYYLPRMAIYLFPWSFLLPGLLQRAQRHNEPSSLSRFLLLAWLLPLLFFSVSSAKANYYLIAVMPFAVFQFALAIENRAFLRPWLRILPGVLIAALAGALYAVLASRADSLPAQPAILGATPVQFASIISICFAGTALLCATVAARWARIGILAYLALSAGGALALIVSLQAIEPQVSTRPLVHYLQTELAGRSVYLYRNFEEQSSLPFYLQAPVSVIDSRSYDLYWGNKLQANDLLISSEQFEQVLARRPVAVVVMERQRKDFEASSLFARMKEAQKIGKVGVFVN